MANEIDQSKSPYYDRFNKDKNYQKVLFNPDKPLQNGELNEVQSIISNRIQNIGDAIFRDGDRQSGAELHYTATKSGDSYTYKGKVTAGQVYLAGAIRNIDETPFTYTGTGRIHHIGIQLVQTVVSSTEDATLLDPVIGVPSAFSSGADRLKETVRLTFDSATSAILYTFDGEDLQIKEADNTMSQINKVLAERTYDESGSYKVEGLTVWTEPLTANVNVLDADGNITRVRKPEDSLQLVIDAGKAYIKGYQVYKPTGMRTYMDKVTATRDITNEGTYYSAATGVQALSNGFIKSVNNVTAQVRVTQEVVARGTTANGADFMKNTNILKIEKVWTASTTYTQGTDYLLTNGQVISWSPSGNEPAVGTSYYVTYIYNKTMVNGTDYKVVTSGADENKKWSVSFSSMTGDKPVDQTIVYVSYTFYLYRQDLITMNPDGTINIKYGQPDTLDNVTPPNHLDPYTLRLATILVYPNSNKTESADVSVVRLSMEDLRKMKTRIDDLEYNQAVNYLDKSAMDNEDPIYLRGVFSDGFISLDKYDSTHPDARIAFSFEDAEITLPYDKSEQSSPDILPGDSEAHVWGRLVTAPFTETKAISQPLATEAMNVNPYNAYNKMGVLTLSPSSDNWIEENRITITQQEVKTMTARMWWNHLGESWSTGESAKLSKIQFDKDNSGTSINAQGKAVTGAFASGSTGTILSSGGSQTKESMIEYMRQIQVGVSVSNLPPNENNLYLTFDGIRCALTPASGYKKGATAGTGMANADGTFSGTFTIPSGVRCGTKEVTVQSANSLASSSFTAQGTQKTTEDIIIRTRVTVNLVDPLAQSFQFTTSRVVSSFGLYFASKSATDNVVVQVRGMSEGGMPNKTIYAETVLTPSQIKVSNNATAETKVTFDDPLMIDSGKEYCIVIMTDSQDYTMWLATMGQGLISNQSQTVMSNPYIQGVLYSSSNASAWTVHQYSDLTFNVYTADFNSEAVIEFDTIENLSVDRVVLMSTYLTPANTGCTWEMKIVLGNEASNITVANKSWLPISNYADLDVEQIAREVKLRAIFEANRFMSPMLSLEDILLSGFLTSLSGSYISRTIDLTDAPFNTIKLQYDQFTPDGTTVVPKWSSDGGNTWKSFTSSATVTNTGTGFQTMKYSEKVTIGTATYKSFKIRLDLKTQNSFKRPRVKYLMATMKNE